MRPIHAPAPVELATITIGNQHVVKLLELMQRAHTKKRPSPAEAEYALARKGTVPSQTAFLIRLTDHSAIDQMPGRAVNMMVDEALVASVNALGKTSSCEAYDLANFTKKFDSIGAAEDVWTVDVAPSILPELNRSGINYTLTSSPNSPKSPGLF